MEERRLGGRWLERERGIGRYCRGEGDRGEGVYREERGARGARGEG